jgi:hypothetical protein
MNDVLFDKLLDKALNKAGEAAELAYALYGLLGGDDPEDAALLLQQYGYTDENGEWKYGENDA